jgi:hypothetical protein
MLELMLDLSAYGSNVNYIIDFDTNNPSLDELNNLVAPIYCKIS